MRGTLSLGTHLGIPVKVHWTFGLLFLFVIYIAHKNNIPQEDIPWFFGVILFMFFFVILHEYGHALMAKRYGVKTQDIIISPIGGVARLESIPKIARHELMIAIAGPMVNVVLALLFGILLWGLDYYYMPQSERINLLAAPNDFIAYLFSINVALIFFNMIPAFPMDGGRVLRSLISMMLDNHLKATKIASYIGQVLAVGFVMVGGYYEHYLLLFIGIFIFLAARAERRYLQHDHKLISTTLGDIAKNNFYKPHHTDLINSLDPYSKDQGSFLVYDEHDQIIGVLPQLYIEDAKENHYDNQPITSYMSQNFGYLNERMNLKTAFSTINGNAWALAIVIDNRRNIKGVVDRQLLLQFLRQT